jgi:hypothetical protein
MMNNVEKIGSDAPKKNTGVSCPSLKVNGLMISGK